MGSRLGTQAWVISEVPFLLKCSSLHLSGHSRGQSSSSRSGQPLYLSVFLFDILGSSWRAEVMLSVSWGSGRSIWDVMCENALSTVNGFTNHFCNHFVLRGGAGLKIRMLYGFDGFLESCKLIRFLKTQSPQHLVMSPFRGAQQWVLDCSRHSVSKQHIPFIKCQSSHSKFAQTRRKAEVQRGFQVIPGWFWQGH